MIVEAHADAAQFGVRCGVVVGLELAEQIRGMAQAHPACGERDQFGNAGGSTTAPGPFERDDVTPDGP